MTGNINRFGRRNVSGSGNVNGAWSSQVLECAQKSGAMSRGQFIRGAGFVGGAVAATGLGFAKSVKAISVQKTYLDNPDPVHIRKARWDAGQNKWIDEGPAKYGDSNILIIPIGNPNRKTLINAGRLQDPRISKLDESSIVWDPTNGYFISAKPLSERPDLPPGTEWDPRRRTLDAMNIEWAANIVAKNGMDPGLVVLKNTSTPFEFGTDFQLPLDLPPGFGVFILNDCTITGEYNGSTYTKVNNGFCSFTVNWYNSYYYYLAAGLPPGAQIWHNAAANFKIKDLVINGSVQSPILAYNGVDLSISVPDFPFWQITAITNVAVENVEIINNLPNPVGAPVNLPILLENWGAAIVNNSSITLDPASSGSAIGIICDGPGYVEIMGNRVDTLAYPDSQGIIIYNYTPDSQGFVTGNTEISASTLGILVGGFNVTISGNNYSNNLIGWQVGMKNKWVYSGCVMLDVGSFGNIVNETAFPNTTFCPTKVCCQVADLTVNNPNPNTPRNNVIMGFEQCDLTSYASMIQKILQSMQYQALKARIDNMKFLRMILPPPYGRIPGWPKDV